MLSIFPPIHPVKCNLRNLLSSAETLKYCTAFITFSSKIFMYTAFKNLIVNWNMVYHHLYSLQNLPMLQTVTPHNINRSIFRSLLLNDSYLFSKQTKFPCYTHLNIILIHQLLCIILFPKHFKKSLSNFLSSSNYIYYSLLFKIANWFC